MNIISKKKYLKKNEFRYNKSPEVRNPKGEGHTAYVSARSGNKFKINIITHAKSFFGEPTVPLHKNPHRDKPSKKQSHFSVPRWEQEQYLREKPKGYWNLDKKDKIAIKKFNKKYNKR